MTPRAERALDALVLTGGRSRRMGQPKALLPHPADSTLAEVVGRTVAEVAEVALEVGGGWTRLPWCRDRSPGSGPLQAIVTGRHALRAGLRRDPDAPLLVVAVDLPLVSVALLGVLATWDHPGSVVPVCAGRPQPLLARWSGAALAEAARRSAAGEQRVRWLADLDDTLLLPEPEWVPLAGARGALTATDVDEPGDWARLAAELQRSTTEVPP